MLIPTQRLCASMLALGLTALPFGIAAQDQDGIPAMVRVAMGNQVVLEAKAQGSIQYECREDTQRITRNYAWAMVGPKATLTDENGKEVGRYFGPPASWEHTDGSKVTGSEVAKSFNGDKNIPLQLVKAEPAAGQGVLIGVSYIQRLATEGGIAPQGKCTEKTLGEKIEVPYKAKYVFWQGP